MNKVLDFFAVGCGCALGALVRYASLTWLGPFLLSQVVILVVNVSGCLLFGYVKGYGPNNLLFQKFITTGFCGGLTTFSTFMVGTTLLFEGHLLCGSGYLLFTLSLGLCAVYGGEKLGQAKKEAVV